MRWTCRHCQSWSLLICILGRDVYPNGTPDTCEHFAREPGTDDDLRSDASTDDADD